MFRRSRLHVSSRREYLVPSCMARLCIYPPTENGEGGATMDEGTKKGRTRTGRVKYTFVFTGVSRVCVRRNSPCRGINMNAHKNRVVKLRRPHFYGPVLQVCIISRTPVWVVARSAERRLFSLFRRDKIPHTYTTTARAFLCHHLTQVRPLLLLCYYQLQHST